jgi:hypothetical protein
VRALVRALHEQCVESKLVFELNLIDDASTTNCGTNNAQLANEFTNVNYTALPTNIGRAAIRNLLASTSKYTNLLFMDCDSMPCNNSYIHNYIPYLNTMQVVYGGRAYSDDAINIDYFLHWLYGSKREVKTAEERTLQPYMSFLSNNFLVPKNIITQHTFNETITQYGHEDTLWAMLLQQNNIPLLHIDNALYHIGLDDAKAFIHKTKLAVHNLHTLNGQYPQAFASVKLLRYATRITQLKLKNIVVFCVQKIERKLLNNLNSVTPSLLALDVLKLYWYLTIDHEESITN